MEVKEKIVGNRITQEKVLWQEDIWKLVEVLIKRALKVFLEKVLEEDVREGISGNQI